MLTKAESYVPAIVYATAGDAIKKHAAVVLHADGLVFLSAGHEGEQFLGIAVEAVEAGGHVLVQTDGIRYGWEGTPSVLVPGAVYYTAPAGALTTESGVRVGLATDTTTLVFSSGGGYISDVDDGGDSGDSGSIVDGLPVYEFIRLISSPLTIESRIATTWVPLKTPVKNPTDILEIRLLGCGVLIPGVDYIITTTPPTIGAGIASPTTAMPIGNSGNSIVYTAINFDPNLLAFTAPDGEESILPRMRLGDRLLVVRKDVK